MVDPFEYAVFYIKTHLVCMTTEPKHIAVK